MSVAAFFDLNANAKFTSILSWAVARAQRVQMTRLDSTRRTVSLACMRKCEIRRKIDLSSSRSFGLEPWNNNVQYKKRTIHGSGTKIHFDSHLLAALSG